MARCDHLIDALLGSVTLPCSAKRDGQLQQPNILASCRKMATAARAVGAAITLALLLVVAAPPSRAATVETDDGVTAGQAIVDQVR
jgi:hypothetical protein